MKIEFSNKFNLILILINNKLIINNIKQKDLHKQFLLENENAITFIKFIDKYSLILTGGFDKRLDIYL